MLVDNSKNWSIKKSKVPAAGKGLYSRIAIPKNKILGECYGKRYSAEDYRNSNVDPMYVWRANDGTYVDAMPIVRGNPLRYVNAPQNIQQADWVNTKVVMKYGKVYYKTTKKIKPGEELWVDYGGGYFSGSQGRPNYLKDPETESILMIGEIGGSSEEEAAEFIKSSKIKKPIVGFIAGITAPPGRRMGHAGAIISGGKGNAEDKIEKMKSCGILIAESPAQIGKTLHEKLAR